MPPRVQLRRHGTADWERQNPTLHNGEPGYDEDTGQLKIGDGKTAWVDLADAVSGGSEGGGLDEAAVQALIDASVAGKLDGEWEVHKIPNGTVTGPWTVTGSSFAARLGAVMWLSLYAFRSAVAAPVTDVEVVTVLPAQFAGPAVAEGSGHLYGYNVYGSFLSVTLGVDRVGGLWGGDARVFIQPEDKVAGIPVDSGYDLYVNESFILAASPTFETTYPGGVGYEASWPVA